MVVPAWNEEASVGAVVARVRAALPDADCLVVDDGSTDSTADVARAAGALVASLPFNLGVGGAMRVGFKYAERRGYTVVVQIDADGQHDPADAPPLIAALDSADVVIGARFAGVGSYSVTGPRRWAMRLLSTAIGHMARTRLTDTTSGFRATGPRAIAVFAERYPAEYLGDTIEALVIAARDGLVLTQLPVAMNAREAGRPSHNPFKAGVYLARASMSLVFALVRPRSAVSETGAAK